MSELDVNTMENSRPVLYSSDPYKVFEYFIDKKHLKEEFNASDITSQFPEMRIALDVLLTNVPQSEQGYVP